MKIEIQSSKRRQLRNVNLTSAKLFFNVSKSSSQQLWNEHENLIWCMKFIIINPTHHKKEYFIHKNKINDKFRFNYLAYKLRVRMLSWDWVRVTNFIVTFCYQWERLDGVKNFREQLRDSEEIKARSERKLKCNFKRDREWEIKKRLSSFTKQFFNHFIIFVKLLVSQLNDTRWLRRISLDPRRMRNCYRIRWSFLKWKNKLWNLQSSRKLFLYLILCKWELFLDKERERKKKVRKVYTFIQLLFVCLFHSFLIFISFSFPWTWWDWE